MGQKGFIQIIVVIIFLILVGGGAYYFGTKKGSIIPTETQTPVTTATDTTTQIAPTSKPTTDPTASWKTFTHPTSKYQFKYPSGWTAAINKYASAETLFGPNASPATGLGGVEVRELEVEPQDFYKLTESKVIESNPKTINGISGYRYIYSNIMTSNGFVFKYKDGLIYNIYINTDNAQDLKIFDQILSSFKFTQ